MSKVRLAVIGCGFIGKHHLDAARALDGVEVVAVADLDGRRAKETADQFGVRHASSDADAVLRDPSVDAVVLAMPTAGRSRLALIALNAGKHVLVEKPTAMNAGEILQMIAAQGQLVCASCASRYRFSPAARVATELIASGALGDLRHVRLRVVDGAGPPPQNPPPAWRTTRAINGGGLLVNWGTYDLDFLLGITGWSLVPREVLAQTWQAAPQLSTHVAPGSDAECHAVAFIRCEGGTVITLERGELLAAVSDNAVEIIGTQGSLRLTMYPVDGTWSVIHDTVSPQHGVVSKALWTAGKDEPILAATPLGDFITAIRDRRPPRTSLEQALVITKITDAIYASVDRGVAVSLVNGKK